MKHPVLTAILAFLVSFPAFAAEAVVPISLESLVHEGLDKSPAVLAKKSEYDAARAGVINAWLPMDPMVGVDVEGQPNLFDNDERMNYEYMVSQTIPFPTKLFWGGVIASKEADRAYQLYKEEELSVAWRIEQPSYRLLLSKRTARALEENKTLLEQMSQVVKGRYESGAADQADYLKVQIELAQVSIELYDWQQKAFVAEAEVSRVLGRPLDTAYAFEEKTARGTFIYTPEDLEQLALKKKPELKAFEKALERARASSALAQTEWLPDITGRIEARKFRGEDSVREYDNFIGVTVPVWSLLKGVGGGWASAAADVKAAEAMLEDMRNETLFRVREAYAEVKSAENALNTYEALIVPQSRQQVDVNLSSYEANKTDALNLIDSQRTFKNAQIGYYKALSDYEAALSNLRLAVGDELK